MQLQLAILSVVLSVFTTQITAYPNSKRATGGSFEEWALPGPDDVRGPCPALNTLANHGYLPRSGKNITIDILNAAFDEGLNVGPEIPTHVLSGILAFLNKPSLDLNELLVHNIIEHDASLSRADAPGNIQAFDQKMWSQFLTGLPEGQTTWDVASAGTGRYIRVQDSKATNPAFTYREGQMVTSYAETTIFLAILSTPSTLNPSLEFSNIFFSEERLPFAEGWRRSEETLTRDSTFAGVQAIQAATNTTGGTVPEALITNEMFTKVFG